MNRKSFFTSAALLMATVIGAASVSAAPEVNADAGKPLPEGKVRAKCLTYNPQS